MTARRRLDRASIRRQGFGLLRLVVGCLLLGSPAAVSAQEDGIDHRDRFAGFLEAAPHVVVQRGRGSLGSNFDFSARKSNILTNMTFKLGGGVKAPALDRILGRPRPVVYGGVLLPLNESSTIGTSLIETSTPGFEQVEFSKFAIEYQTSGLTGIGLEFEIPILDTAISLTPSLQSLHLVTRYAGQASLQINGLGFNESHVVKGKKKITQHFLGPAVRLAAPRVVIRGFAIDFFLESSLLVDVAGTRKEFVVIGENGDRGEFTFEGGGGVVQVASGLTIRWP